MWRRFSICRVAGLQPAKRQPNGVRPSSGAAAGDLRRASIRSRARLRAEVAAAGPAALRKIRATGDDLGRYLWTTRLRCFGCGCDVLGDCGAAQVRRDACPTLIHDRFLRPNLRVARTLAGRFLPGELAAVGFGRRVGLLDHRRFRAALRDYHSHRAQDDRANSKQIWPKPGGPSVD